MQFSTWVLVSMAEFSHLASVISIFTCCLVMVAFMLRHFFQDIRDGNQSSLTRVYTQIPQIEMERRDLPVVVKNISSNEDLSSLPCVKFDLKLATDSVLFRVYWGVSVKAFHHILKAPWPWFQEAFLHGNLFGSSSCLGLSDLKTLPSNEDFFTIEEKLPEGVELNLGPGPREVYPVVCCFVPNKDYYESTNVGAMLYVVHIKDDTCRIATHVLATYLKHTQPPLMATHLVSIYTTEETGDGELLCAVCQELNVTRVILPCKHACVCRRCFDRLSGRCPMCRTYIQSFFIIQEESESETDSQDAAEPASDVNQRRSWRQRLDDLNQMYAMAMGLQEN